MTEKKKIGRPRTNKEGEWKRVNLVMTPKTQELLDVVMRETGTTSRSEAIRLLIFQKAEELMKR